MGCPGAVTGHPNGPRYPKSLRWWPGPRHWQVQVRGCLLLGTWGVSVYTFRWDSDAGYTALSLALFGAPVSIREALGGGLETSSLDSTALAPLPAQDRKPIRHQRSSSVAQSRTLVKWNDNLVRPHPAAHGYVVYAPGCIRYPGIWQCMYALGKGRAPNHQRQGTCQEERAGERGV